ncbi:MAG: hypothetical protein HOQ21_09980 [Dermatophilaceae bacterium]|nr:hypothetical protein [Dermatophilaceae bacterium]
MTTTKRVAPGLTPSRLATDPAYLAHAIAALRVATHAEPLAYMDKFPCPKPSRLEPMSQEAAAWIREHVWPKGMQKTFGEVPNFYLHCACQWGLTQWCRMDKHRKCHRATGLKSHETYVLKRGGTHPARFAEELFHCTPTATGGHRMTDAQVWLGDRVCRWLCPCECHGEPGEPIRQPLQLDLFGST